MTGAEFKSIRLRAGLTQRQLAERLRISDHRSIRRYETGERTISGPVTILMEWIDVDPDKQATWLRILGYRQELIDEGKWPPQ